MQFNIQSLNYALVMFGCGIVTLLDELLFSFYLFVGGALFGIFGSKTNRHGRDPIVLLGYIVHMACFYLCFLNFPSKSPMEKDSNEVTYITPK